MKKIWRSLLMVPFISLTGCQNWPRFYVEKKPDYEYHTNVQYGEYIRTFVDICYPKEIKSKGLILFIHGGGWTIGDKSVYKSDMVEYSTRYGVTCAAMNYHYITKGEYSGYTELNDITKALDKVTKYSREQNVVLDKAILTGGSAGGHLSALYASRCRNESPLPIVATWLYSPVTSLYSDAFIKENALTEDNVISLMSRLAGVETTNVKDMEHELKDLSPMDWVLAKTPRTLICIGANDNVAPYQDNLHYIELLEEKGISYDVVTYEHSGHGLEDDVEADLLDQKFRDQYIEELFY